jgi:hypothetical protein
MTSEAAKVYPQVSILATASLFKQEFASKFLYGRTDELKAYNRPIKWICDAPPELEELVQLAPCYMRDRHESRIGQFVAWVRHELTNYDALIDAASARESRYGDKCSEETQEALHKEANRLILAQYPALSSVRDFERSFFTAPYQEIFADGSICWKNA